MTSEEEHMEVNKIYFKDARDMSEVEEGSITLIVTSPPYYNVKDYALDGKQGQTLSDKVPGQIGDIEDYNDYLRAMVPVWKECERVLEPNGKLCVNVPLMPLLKSQVNTHHTRHIVDINAGIEWCVLHETELFLYDIFIWNRSNPQKTLMFGSYPYPPNFYAQNTVEFITVYVKEGRPKRRREAIKEASKLGEQQWVEYTQQVWHIPIPGKDDLAYGYHPAIMPEEIVRRLIRLFSFVDDIILDPFLGSGTTAKVAQEERRKYIGYEIMESYRPVIERKVAQVPLGI